MPAFTARFVRVALVYLALGFTLGALMLANEAFAFYPSTWRLLPIHMEMLLVGWFIQLAAGVAFWILPRLSSSAPRGNENLVWLSFWLINGGIIVVILEAITSLPILLLLGRLAEMAGTLVFVSAVWSRVKSFSG